MIQLLRALAQRWTHRAGLRLVLGVLLAGNCVSVVAGAGSGKRTVVRVGAPIEGEVLPPVAPKVPANLQPSVEEIGVPRKGVVVNFETVFSLVQSQNGQVAIYQAKVDEALGAQAVAYQHFPPPDLHIRKCIEKKVETDVQVWRAKADLARITSENLQDAAYTYVDLLVAKTGEGIALDIETKLKVLLSQAQKLAEIDPSIKVEPSRVDTEIAAQRQVFRKVRENYAAAAAKLIYLLGLDPHTILLVGEREFAPLQLIDARQPVDALVGQALVQGPGVYELESMLSVIEQARARAESSRLSHFESAGRRQVRDARANQAYFALQDLQSKLTLGVREGREASLSNLEQIELARANIKLANETFNLADYRLKNAIKGRSPTEVLLAIRSFGEARLNYLQAVREYNRAQIRLFIILGSSR